MQCMAGKVFMAAKLNFHQKAVAKEGGRREDIAGGFFWSEKRKDRERESGRWARGRKGLDENHDVEVQNVKNKDEVRKEHVNCDQRI